LKGPPKDELPFYLESFLTIPLGLVFKMEKQFVDPDRALSKDNVIEIITKDFRHLRFSFPDLQKCKSAYSVIHGYVYPDDEFT